VSAKHDGIVPDPQDLKRHVDGRPYRLAAIRETFEESGILLAKNPRTGDLVTIEESERESARKAIHRGDISFPEFVKQKGGVPDTGRRSILASGPAYSD
jgi:8-oxo-dGTP pyrophosphatase MutT (NUDIX family)